MKKRIFLTGGSGFIGKNIKESLGNQYDIFAPTHRELDLLDSNSVENYLLKNGQFDVVLHTAIVGGNRMTGDTKDNALDSLRMFFNVASKRKYFKRFFYFGSGIEYGKEKPIKNFDENNFDMRLPQSNWGLYKYICAKHVEATDDFINLRIFGAFGKYEDIRVRFISNSICRNILNLPIVINQNIRMDYLYIDDLVKIIDFFIKNRFPRPKSRGTLIFAQDSLHPRDESRGFFAQNKGKSRFKTYNLTPGKSTDLVSIARIINSISGKRLPIKIRKRGLSPEYTGNNIRLMRELGDFKFTEIQLAIKELYSWYLKNKKLIDTKEVKKDYF